MSNKAKKHPASSPPSTPAKRKAASAPTDDPTPSTSSAPDPTPPSLLQANPFSSLSQPEEENVTLNKEELPPPIYVKNVNDFIVFIKELTKALGKHEFSCKSRTQDIMLRTESPNGYRLAVQYLRKMNAQFHTFQLKEEKPLRVVIRNLHSSTPTEIIKEELEALDFNVKTVTPVLHPITKDKLHLFFVDLEPTKRSQDIYDLKNLLRTIIKVEEPHKKRELIQCKRCQNFGHSKGYCNYTPTCVKCAEHHLTSDCPKSRDTPAKCALCNGQHPASYKGCNIYKELRKRTHRHPNQPQKVPPPPVDSIVNFPALQPQSNERSQGQQEPEQLPLHEISDRQSKSTYASVTGHRRQPSQVPVFIPPPSSSDITSILNSFLSDLKSVIMPLISLITQVMTSLLPSLSKITHDT